METSGNVGGEPQEEFLTVEETAELLKVSTRTIYDLARAGELPGAKKLGNQWRVHKPTLVASWPQGRPGTEPNAGEGSR